MKIVPMLLIICFLAAGIFLISIGCEDPPPSGDKEPTPQEKWSTLVNLRKGSYDLLSVEESQRWLEENADMADDQKALQGIIIDVDPNGNRRVFKLSRSGNGDRLQGYMTTEESIRWLKAQGYQVERNDNGYTLKREVIENRVGIDINSSEKRQIGWGSTIVLDTGTVITTDSGTIRIKVGGTQ